VISADATHSSSVLFCRERDAEREIWEGLRHGPQAARELFGFDTAYPVGELDARMPGLITNARTLHYALGTSPALDESVRRWLDAVRRLGRTGASAPAHVLDLTALLDEMRVIKDAYELQTMRRAAKISAQAHLRAMRACRPGVREYELEAELLYEFRRHGAQAPAYGSIVAAGANACVLHYPAGNAVARDTDLILIDAAFDGYASDITRTFPASGRFTGAQRELYDIVLAAQQAAIDATRAGVSFDAPHQAAVRVLVQGMLDTKLLDPAQHGSVDDVIASRAYTRFYMHRTGHWIGMDVHDCGDYREPDASPTAPVAHAAPGEARAERPWRALRPNMTLTIEPGLYVRPAPDVPQAYWNIGIRIEDDAIVTATGCELITRDVPVGADDIEALMRDARHRE
jgi:Xaa-Pro aminopeptidase